MLRNRLQALVRVRPDASKGPPPYDGQQFSGPFDASKGPENC